MYTGPRSWLSAPEDLRRGLRTALKARPAKGAGKQRTPEGIMEKLLAKAPARAAGPEDSALDSLALANEILADIHPLRSADENVAELLRILKEPHFRALLEARDTLASEGYEPPPASSDSPLPPEDAVQLLSIHKRAGEPLGVTLRVENNDLVIARILRGGVIDRGGLLRVGDVIKEADGRRVGTDAGGLQELLRTAGRDVLLKILPSSRRATSPQDMFVKCHFDYDPGADSLIPCQEVGLSFSRGDVLQIVNTDDPNWWQARHAEEGSSTAAGLVPSQTLEEKRKAFVRCGRSSPEPLCGAAGSQKKKRRIMYDTHRNADFDRHEIQIYEEVVRAPPFQRKVLVLIGAQGVGRRTLKNILIVLNPSLFGTTVPFTSRKPRKGEDEQVYRFVSRPEMEADIRAGRYLEYGEYQGNLYGTKTESIFEVTQAGKTCILDVNPRALKLLRTADFMPYVVFIAAPKLDILRAMHEATVNSGITTKLPTQAMLQRTVSESGHIQGTYSHYFDLTIVNDDLDKAFEKLLAAFERLRTEPQWIPVSWLY
ncbi:protein PALS2-like isoform X2 [Monodelphis domestica]|nr:protein PALS2-like isoform X2 [Monodelphis domestica]XP_056665674.1 protein PALS2-like isoform X2 [Monodelphis domestica]